MTRRIPSQIRSRDKVDKIIRVSARIIEEEGIEAFTTNRIAKRAGVGVASVYEYFENKDAILARVLEHELEELSSRLMLKLPAIVAMPFEPACRELFGFILAEVSRKSELMRVIAGHFHGASQSVPIVRFFGQAEMMIRMLLTRFSRDPVHDVALDAYLITHAFAGVCIGIGNGLPPGQRMEDVIERMVDIARHLAGREQEATFDPRDSTQQKGR